MAKTASRIARHAEGEFVKLPPEVAYGSEMDVTVERRGDVVTIYPRKTMTMKEMLRQLRNMPAPDRVQERIPIEFPERPGL